MNTATNPNGAARRRAGSGRTARRAGAARGARRDHYCRSRARAYVRVREGTTQRTLQSRLQSAFLSSSQTAVRLHAVGAIHDGRSAETDEVPALVATMGMARDPAARSLLVTVDWGGGNGAFV
jgi:hypothetical protein